MMCGNGKNREFVRGRSDMGKTAPRCTVARFRDIGNRKREDECPSVRSRFLRLF